MIGTLLYKIGTAARLVGVEPATLRNWEQRYGVVVAARGAGAQRAYGREDVERLRRVKAWIDSGLSASEAHRLLQERLENGADRRAREAREQARRLRAEIAAKRERAAAETAGAGRLMRTTRRRRTRPTD